MAATVAAAAFATALVHGRGVDVAARQDTPPLSLGTSASLNGLPSSTLVFVAADADKNRVVSRDELKAAAGRWFTALIEHILAGMQYVLGDLKVDDTPIKR